MAAQKLTVPSICLRIMSVLWAALGAWLLSNLRKYDRGGQWTQAVGPLLGLAFVVAAWGCWRNQRWGRIALGCLVTFAVLWSADMLLFIAFRGLANRHWLLVLILGLVFASVSTWTLLAATNPRLEQTGP